jgi:probable serine/threonine-protein kinase DDB_G0288147
MRLIKKNQVVIYVIALMLVVAGYLNFTTNGDLKSAVQTASSEEELEKMANIGDAQLVSSNVVSENDVKSNESVNTETNTEKANEENNNSNNENSTNVAKNENSEENQNEDNKQGGETVETSSNNKDNNDYFTTSRLERDTMYSQILETYEKILNSSNSLETQKQSATEEIKRINDIKNSIMICENLIKTKGFENVVIFVNGDSVSIIVKDAQLNTEKVAQIQNIISREMNTKVENIHISNK